ncbi:nodulation protein NodH [Defluviimonas sp. WL0002]|uniref:Nodulation protein NodH n=1 Tax=Albidovulum marisflavi TaxID=2984159 RepID=A0ABT2Z8K3_9RHOB|nr:nodulation protein NodH [Defluviimonas sp. WL0002]MCV2867352.1 nodulation protein NodH [Defluviimonas sp. WL0002]
MADTPFDSFVILAAMRTGSNLLEESLNAVPGLFSHGEAFNPSFVGGPKKDELLGMTLQEREADPGLMLDRIAAAEGLNGFRYFPDHDPRVLERFMRDRRCAKVVLTRNPLESYVSLKIARKTGQWKLGRARDRKDERILFDPQEFEGHLEALQGFQLTVLRLLQGTGQTAFYLDYEDVRDEDVLTGLVTFLGVPVGAVKPSAKLIKQNPSDMAELVANHDEMQAALSRLDRFNLSRTPNFEPRRGPGVPGFIAARDLPVLFMPVRGGPSERVTAWMSKLPGGLQGDFTQKTLRDWMRAHPGHRSFTVLSHPVVRAHRVFSELMGNVGAADFRDYLKRAHGLALPRPDRSGAISAQERRRAFLGFLAFFRASLVGQASVRPDPAWSSQSALVSGFSQFAPPDLIAREDELAEALAHLVSRLGLPMPDLPPPPAETALAEIYDAEVEKAARAAYQRDYLVFGFRAWRDQAA